MQDKVIITFKNGDKKEVKLPKYGELKITIRNEKITDIETTKKEKIC